MAGWQPQLNRTCVDKKVTLNILKEFALTWRGAGGAPSAAPPTAKAGTAALWLAVGKGCCALVGGGYGESDTEAYFRASSLCRRRPDAKSLDITLVRCMHRGKARIWVGMLMDANVAGHDGATLDRNRDALQQTPHPSGQVRCWIKGQQSAAHRMDGL